MERPAGITAIGIYYLIVGAYACTFAAFKLITSGSFDLPVWAPLWNELEFYGERYALVFGLAWCLIGWGLLKLQRWARWAGVLGMVPAIVLLVAPISMAKIGFRLLWYGLLIALHAGAGFYLLQAPTARDAFEEK
jgi:apolipoprotein N-acyltransferase